MFKENSKNQIQSIYTKNNNKKISYQSIQKYLCIKELWYTYKKGNNSLIGDIHKILIYKNVR